MEMRKSSSAGCAAPQILGIAAEAVIGVFSEELADDRGLLGEGSAAHGDMFQVSNRATLGVAEEQVIRRVQEREVVEVIHKEVQQAMNAAPPLGRFTRADYETIAENVFGTLARRMIVELLLSNHPDDCLFCNRSGHCELQGLARELDIRPGRMMFWVGLMGGS
jgi:hypothetical protein